MEKLKLNVDELRIEGFATSIATGEAQVMAATLRCTTICTEIDSCGHVCP